MPTTLGEVASLIRSKNAGPFVLTFDIMFKDLNAFQRVLNSNAINKKVISKLYSVEEKDIFIFHSVQALAIKVSIPRRQSVGGLRESDGHGGQQYGPLVGIELTGT